MTGGVAVQRRYKPLSAAAAVPLGGGLERRGGVGSRGTVWAWVWAVCFTSDRVTGLYHIPNNSTTRPYPRVSETIVIAIDPHAAAVAPLSPLLSSPLLSSPLARAPAWPPGLRCYAMT